MKLSTKQKAELLLVHESYWDYYVKGDVKAMASLLDAGYTQVGSAEGEVFSTKKEAVQFLYDTIDQVTGKMQMRNRQTRLEQQGQQFLIHELCDLYALTGKKWVFYAKFRASTLIRETKTGWKITHQHSSFPDSKTEAGQNVAIDKIAEENKELREAVKRRTQELEGTNWELKVEAALERVRARGMAMHASDELAELVAVLFTELTKLDVGLNSCLIWIHDFEQQKEELWVASHNINKPAEPFYIHPFHPAFFKSIVHAWKSKDLKWVFELKGQDKKKFQDAFFKEVPKLPKALKSVLDKNAKVYFSASFNNFGALEIIGDKPLSAKSYVVLHRFGKVFEQTYTRFLDLQKAEAQAREAQIETALERVRSRTMAMQSSGDLAEVASIMFKQLQELGTKQWTSGFDIWQPDQISATAWVSNRDGSVASAFTLPFTEDPFFKKIYDARQRGKNFFVMESSGKSLEGTYKYMFKFPMAKKFFDTNTKLGFQIPTFQITHCVFFSYGFLIFITYEPVPEMWDVFKRFANVFEQTYTRFLDLQKAAAQAREANIETALERVRSASMAIHKSEELHKVVLTVSQEINSLGLHIDAAHLIRFEEGNDKGLNMWIAGDGGMYPYEVYFPYIKHELFDGIYDARKTHKNFFTISRMSKKEKNRVYRHLIKNTKIKVSERRQKFALEANSWAYSVALAKHSGMAILKFSEEGAGFSVKENEILRRFSNVFEQAFIRFLSLAKAEKQAREAQIEAALERIRARSMAMHSSEELNDVLKVMFQQIEVLGIDAKCAHLTLMDLENNNFSFRITGKNGAANIGEQFIDLNAMPIWKETVAKWKKAKPHSHQCLVYAPEILPDLWNLIATSLKSLPANERIKISDFPNGLFDCEGHHKFGYLGFNNSRPPTDEEISIAIRFATEFERVYQRFLDIEKAEAQARESQIQLSMERVRARSLAMQSTDELHEVLGVLFRQFDDLGIKPVNVFLSLFDREARTLTYRASGKSGKRIPGKQVVEVDKMEALQSLFDKWLTDNSDNVEVIFYPKEVLPQLFGVFSETFSSMPERDRIGVKDFPNGGYSMAGYTPFGYLGYDHQRQATEEEKEILTRFCVEFTRVYQRFLDVQKAEAQAREAKIEAALEKVRSRSLAMHNSKELQQVVNVVYDQLKELGLQSQAVAMSGTIKPKSTYEVWVGGSTFSEPLVIPYTDSTQVQREYNEAIESRSELFSKTFSGEIKKEYFEFLLSQNKIPDEQIKLIHASDAFTTSISFTKNSSIQMVRYSGVAYSVAENQILIRFANVFEQAYVRFMDLQKAEAQAREARIETALERVRARSMGMHQTDELSDVLCVLLEQFDFLGINPVLTHLTLMDEANETFTLRITSSPKERVFAEQKIDINAVESWKASFENWKKGEPNSVDCIDYPPEVLPYVWEVMNEVMTALPEGYKINPEDFPDGLYTTQGHFKFGYLGFNHSRRATEEEKNIVSRFAIEFGRVYQRFLDIQKAEAQAKESEVQLALERVRAKAMAMQRTEELNEVIGLLCEQYDTLGINPVCAHLSLIDVENNRFSLRLTGKKGARNVGEQIIDANAMPVWAEAVEKWRNSEPLSHQCLVYPPEEVPTVMSLLDGVISTMPEEARISAADFPDGLFSCEGQNKFGNLGFNHSRPPTEEEIEIVVRFAREFERIYQRFLDLEKAEAQTRESQIEAALERVRSRSMAMHESKEMLEVIEVVSEQLQQLKLNFDTVSFAKNRQEGDFTFWFTSRGQPKPLLMEVPKLDSPVLKRIYGAQEKRVPFLADVFSAAESRTWHEHLIKYSDLKYFSESIKAFIRNAPGFARSSFLLKNIDFYVGNYRAVPFTEEENSIFGRFAHVFEQAYTRFIDLQKAEAQAREADIELALERVRARTMAMGKSPELAEVVAVIYKEIERLGLADWGCNIQIMNEANHTIQFWLSSSNADFLPNCFYFHDDGHPGIKKQWEYYKNKLPKSILSLKGKDKKSYDDYVLNYTDFKYFPEPLKENIRSMENVFFSYSLMKYGFISSIRSDAPLTEDEFSILSRFAKVFEQTYTRFLDLQKAETQAREAQIEAALERVRSRSMAMQHSSELNIILAKVFEELTFLDLEMERAVIWTYYPENRSVRWWAANPESKSGTESYFIGDCDDPVYNEYWKAWEERRTKYLYILEGAYKENWTEILFNKTELGRLPEIVKEAMVKPEKIFLYNTFNEFGVLFIACLEPLVDEKFTILERFGKVFDQSYTRFNDIKQAEAREKEAIKQSSLDRVRGQIASMRSTTDLDRITPLVWDELTTLGVPFIRCGVFIVDEVSETVQVFLSAPDGHSLGVMHMPFTANELTANAVAHWRKTKVYRAHWNQQQFIEFMQTMIDLGQIKDKKTYQGAAKPPVSLDLHFVPFTQGMLYVGSSDRLVEEQVELVQSLADAFAIAYARYEDFIQLEKAKQSIEITLTELKATQSQLIQSEKMASLGELTAGIAHEIQNPLNFVNNFSEVSQELILEITQELDNGNLEDVKEILQDVIQNLQKIVHHGKRADGIVKGMLQHSRSSSGIKEPTDINVLADEYLRLAYHGLRAKDKAFNATLETHFDDSLGRVNVVPQDMGRVILNLITNAFYVVKEKKEQAPKGYEPTVTVRTKKYKNQITISVKDNGNGIPKKVLDKIFQPFFTTKPTGEGTGLGLSMSYDIVTKSHGGELEVKTKEGEGSEFIVSLPIDQ